MSKKFRINKQEDLERLLNTLDEFDLNDDFLDDIESEQEELDSDATSIDSDDGEFPDISIEGDDEMNPETEVEDISQNFFSWTDQPQIDRSAFPFIGNSGIHNLI